MVEGDKVPIYEETLEDVRRFNENPALPFNAFGTLALARAEFDANSGSSQVFFLLKVSYYLLSSLFCVCNLSDLGLGFVMHTATSSPDLVAMSHKSACYYRLRGNVIYSIAVGDLAHAGSVLLNLH